MRARTKLAGSMVGAMAIATGALMPGGAGAAGCVTAKNVELINDDSGSMAITDPSKNRVEAAKLLLSKAANRGGTTYGAVEFAREASPIFNPVKVTSGDLGSLTTLMTQRTQDDGSGAPTAEDPSVKDTGGGTDYNAAFAVANQNNQGADARVFLTDGGHNEGDYANGHKNPSKRTYVVGFGGATSDTTSSQRLQQIATDTGGQYFPQTDASNLTGVVNTIDDKLSCAAKTKTFQDQFTKQGQRKTHTLKTSTSTKSLEFTVLWQGPGNAFDISAIQVKSGKHVVAVGSRKRKIKRSRLKVTRKAGSTFVTVRVRGKGLRKGHSVKFVVKAKQVFGAVPVTTTVSQSKRG